MATTYTAPPRIVAPSMAETIGKTVEIWQLWWNSRRAMRRVRRLDDRLLRDIGLTRGDVGRPEHETALADHWWHRTMLDGRKQSRPHY